MPLTLRQNGSQSANLVTAQWWNDYYNLLTGLMNDQPVTLSYLPGSAASTATLTITSNGNAPYLNVVSSTGNTMLSIGPTGTLSVSSQFTASGLIVANAGITGNGKFGVVSAGDVLDGSGYDTFVKARGSNNLVQIQVGGSTVATFNPNGISLPSNTASIAVGSLLGIKTTGGAKLAEFKNNGTLVINGTTYYTTQASANFGTGATFDGFDLGECYLVDQNYPLGTVVCPNSNNVLTRCTHDGCHAAMVITTTPGYCIGVPDPTSNILPVALSGRVLATCTTTIPAGSLVCSDGAGNVRALASGESNYVIGFTLQPSSNGQVGVFIRPMYAKAP